MRFAEQVSNRRSNGTPRVPGSRGLMGNETELEKARRRVQEGALRISRHRELMAELRAEDQSTIVAERILAEFEKIQAQNLADLGRFGKTGSGNGATK
jgi:hypothetical protein